MQYQTFSQKPGESLDDCFVIFESIVSNLRSSSPLAYSDNEHAKQLMYALNDHMSGMKITILEKSDDFATLDREKLLRKLKSHELSRKGRPNHDAFLTSTAMITSARVGGHDANLTNESISNDEIALLARKFHAMHKFCKERRSSPRGYFECGDTTHFIANCPKWKKFDSSNKYDNTNWNDYSNKGDNKKKNCFRDKKKKKMKKF
jgi:hypothetical protein